MINTETKYYILHRLLPSVVMIFFFFFCIRIFPGTNTSNKFRMSSITINVPPIARHFLKTNKAIRLFVLATACWFWHTSKWADRKQSGTDCHDNGKVYCIAFHFSRSKLHVLVPLLCTASSLHRLWRPSEQPYISYVKKKKCLVSCF